ncbi:MAG: hypothetical protein Q9213_007038 [Squamulea squamosa]
MVRKPINYRSTSQALPYPRSPTSPFTTSPANRFPHEVEAESEQQVSSLTYTTATSDDLKIKGMGKANHAGQSDLPQALQVGHAPLKDQMNEIPPASQVAPAELTPKSSSESFGYGTLPLVAPAQSIALNPLSNNPYVRMKSDHRQGTPANEGNSTAVWADESTRLELSSLENQSHMPAGHNSLPLSQSPNLSQAPFAERWIDFKQSTEQQTLTSAPPTNDYASEVLDPTSEWSRERKGQYSEPSHPFPVRETSYTNELQELEAQPFGGVAGEPRSPNANQKSLPSLPSGSAFPTNNEKSPNLPTRLSTETSPMPPTHPPAPRDPPKKTTQEGPHPHLLTEQQQAKANQQRNQTYQIRLVNWFDSSSPVNPRVSPIMVQNANGPCPLLALVNALVLSTPAGLATALVETLRVREQVSLGLLLDAVIDELMSGRRGDTAQSLPDVSELYAFLINLHTGMNVNPQFVESMVAPTHLLDDPVHVPNTPVDVRKVGGFEETPAMRLYATFAISLIHGWLPRRNHPVCSALSRSAKTYEDAQSLLFVEEELESKLQAQGLTTEEQRLFEDVTSIKHFLTSSPTQLTDYGLDTITETLRPGAIAILFRNDHFSTLFKESRSGRIFTLVTDLGYAGHDEVVWESLVDISGEGSEFFSGDFRPVGNNLGTSSRRSAGPGSAPDDAGWTTVSRSGGRNNARTSLPQHSAHSPTNHGSVTNAFSQLSMDETHNEAKSTNTEQDDHDLALAMQLQEEEDEEAAARRRREDELSQAYLDSTSRQNQRGGRPQVPPRGGGGAKRAPPRRQMEEDSDLPPPSYEQAASGSAYHPPTTSLPQPGASTRANINASGSPGVRPTRQTSAYSQTQTAHAAFTNGGPNPPRRRPAQSDKDKDCVMM